MTLRLLTNPSTSRLPLELEWPLPAVVYLLRAELLIAAAALPLVAFDLLLPGVPVLPVITRVAVGSALAIAAIEMVRRRLLHGWVRRQLAEVRLLRNRLIHELPKLPDLPRERQPVEVAGVVEMLRHLETLADDLDTGLVERFKLDLGAARQRLNSLFPDGPDMTAAPPAVV